MLTVNKTSANAFTWYITSHAGRNQRRFYSKVATSGDESKKSSVNITFIQEGKPEFIELFNTENIINVPASPEAMEYVQIKAVTNSTLVKMTLENDTLSPTTTMYINGETYRPGSLIAGDPGSESEIAVAVNVLCSANPSAVKRSVRIILEDNAGHSVYCDIIQAAATPVLSVSPSSVSVPANGGSGSIMVSSNDSWTVSVVESI
ncbi:MAG: hypothetical protein IJA42_02720 [Bacteroidales bacterium]|nr:hypothetical protein [Bacteroidales bacterium]